VGEEREVMTWDDLGTGTRAIAEAVHADGYRPGSPSPAPCPTRSA
jgi:hypoxanthine phosphoribosyltransferase